jgi:hypothetical protein
MHNWVMGALETCCRQGEMLRIQNRGLGTRSEAMQSRERPEAGGEGPQSIARDHPRTPRAATDCLPFVSRNQPVARPSDWWGAHTWPRAASSSQTFGQSWSVLGSKSASFGHTSVPASVAALP